MGRTSGPAQDLRLDPAQVEAYLDRLGWSQQPPVGTATLQALHLAHLRRVPFENLDIHLGRPISLDPARIVDKLTRQRRGGFCYELNGGFAALLTSLGFAVTLMEARVYTGDRLGIRFDHMCLRVDLEQPYLADVGFGACFDRPLRFVPGLDQEDPTGTYRIEQLDDAAFDLHEDGERQHRFTLTPHRLGDFAGGCDHHQHSPDSHFTRNTVCSLRTPSGRVTVRGLTLIETSGRQRDERRLDSAELGSVLHDRFGITLAESDLGRLASTTPT